MVLEKLAENHMVHGAAIDSNDIRTKYTEFTQKKSNVLHITYNSYFTSLPEKVRRYTTCSITFALLRT